MTKTILKLKPCPFCGAPAEFNLYEAFSCDSSFEYVGCTKCEAKIPRGDAKDWNHRISTPLLASRIKLVEPITNAELIAILRKNLPLFCEREMGESDEDETYSEAAKEILSRLEATQPLEGEKTGPHEHVWHFDARGISSV